MIDYVSLVNWLNRKIFECEHELSEMEDSYSRMDEIDNQHIKGMKSAYEEVKKFIKDNNEI